MPGERHEETRELASRLREERAATADALHDRSREELGGPLSEQYAGTLAGEGPS